MATTEELAFMADPAAFMAENVLRVVAHGAELAGEYKFALIENKTIPASKKNRRGRPVRYFELTKTDTGAISMLWLPYKDSGVRETTLPVSGCDLMTTVQLNGCSFGHAQSSTGAGAYVTHQNARTEKNDPASIESQPINNPLNEPFNYFHQKEYRKSKDGKIDTDYLGTIVGKRDVLGRWDFFVQIKKSHYDKVKNKQSLSLKGVKTINPEEDVNVVDLP